MSGIGRLGPGDGVVDAGGGTVEVSHRQVVGRGDGDGAGERVGIEGRTAGEVVVGAIVNQHGVGAGGLGVVDGGVVGGATEADGLKDIADVRLGGGAVEVEFQRDSLAVAGAIYSGDGGPGGAISQLDIGAAELDGVGGVGDAGGDIEDVAGDILVEGDRDVATAQAGGGEVEILQRGRAEQRGSAGAGGGVGAIGLDHGGAGGGAGEDRGIVGWANRGAGGDQVQGIGCGATAHGGIERVGAGHRGGTVDQGRREGGGRAVVITSGEEAD